MNSKNGDQFIEASRKARLLLIGYIVLLLLIAISLMLRIDRANPPADASQEELNRSIESFEQLIDKFLILTLIQAVFFSWYFVRLANNSIRTGKFPPPGTSVIARTKIQIGKRALVSAYTTYFLVIIIWLPVAIPVYIKWLLEKFT